MKLLRGILYKSGHSYFDHVVMDVNENLVLWVKSKPME